MKLQSEDEAQGEFHVVHGVAGRLADVTSEIEPDATAVREILLHPAADVHTETCPRHRFQFRGDGYNGSYHQAQSRFLASARYGTSSGREEWDPTTSVGDFVQDVASIVVGFADASGRRGSRGGDYEGDQPSDLAANSLSCWTETKRAFKG